MSYGNCDCRRRRPMGCLNSLGGPRPWGWNGGCPDANGCYEQDGSMERSANREDCGRHDCDWRDRDWRDCGCRRRRRGSRDGVFGLYTASLPITVSPNGVIPLVGNVCDCGGDIAVNSGVITLYRPGTYLATVTARVGADTTVDSTITLNVNEASQSSAVLELAGAGPSSATSQAVFEVCDHALVTLRSVDAISVTTPATQPLFTLSLVRLDD